MQIRIRNGLLLKKLMVLLLLLLWSVVSLVKSSFMYALVMYVLAKKISLATTIPMCIGKWQRSIICMRFLKHYLIWCLRLNGLLFRAKPMEQMFKREIIVWKIMTSRHLTLLLLIRGVLIALRWVVFLIIFLSPLCLFSTN